MGCAGSQLALSNYLLNAYRLVLAIQNLNLLMFEKFPLYESWGQERSRIHFPTQNKNTLGSSFLFPLLKKYLLHTSPPFTPLRNQLKVFLVRHGSTIISSRKYFSPFPECSLLSLFTTVCYSHAFVCLSF